MPILLNEFVGFDPKKPTNLSQSKESAEWINKCNTSNNDLAESDCTVAIDGADSYKPDFTTTIEAIHPDVPTRNFTRYMSSSFNKENINTWTIPYNRPLILYHNEYDGQKVGTIINAEVKESKRCKGKNALVLTASIPEYREQFKVSSGLYNTVSIGTSASDVRCSICGSHIDSGEYCEHERGASYKNESTGKIETCYWDVYSWEAKEISFVHVPSDKYAGIVAYTYERYDDTPVSKCDTIPRHYAVPLQSTVKESSVENTTKEDAQTVISLTENDNKGENTLDIKEAEKRISSLETAQKALEGDKKNLIEKVDCLNKDKISLQESVAALKKEAEQKDMNISQEKELREAAEDKVKSLEKEVKLSLAESLAALREKAGKPAIEKLEERSIESLRDSIADLKADIAEKVKMQESEKEKMHTEKGIVKDAQLKENENVNESKAETEVETKEQPCEELFDL